MKTLFVLAMIVVSAIASDKYECKLFKSESGALVAGETFQLTVDKQAISIHSEALGRCEGDLKLPYAHVLVGKAEMGGSHCAADGFDLFLELSVLSGRSGGYVEVGEVSPDNTAAIYLCKMRG